MTLFFYFGLFRCVINVAYIDLSSWELNRNDLENYRGSEVNNSTAFTAFLTSWQESYF